MFHKSVKEIVARKNKLQVQDKSKVPLLYLSLSYLNFTPKQIKDVQFLRNRGLILSRERCVKSERMTSTLITWQEYFVVSLLLLALLKKMAGNIVFSFCSLSSRSDLLIINGVNPNIHFYCTFLRGVSNLTMFLSLVGSLYEGKVHVNFSLIFNFQFVCVNFIFTDRRTA